MRNKEMSRIKITILLLLLLSIVAIPLTHAQEQRSETIAKTAKAVIYFNEACGMCSQYLNQVKEALAEIGIKNVTVKDYVNFKEYRKELLQINKKHNIPPSLQGHLVTIINEKFFFEGHVPVNLIREALDYDQKVLIYQDKMEGATTFDVWMFKGEPKTYSIDSSLEEYIKWFEENKDSLKEINSQREFKIENLLPVVITTGLLAGIHPCTIAVLLFFLAFMFTLQSSRLQIFKIGLAYIAGIFAAFSAIGLGIFKAMVFSTPHFAAKIAGILVLMLGLFNIYNYFFKTNISLGLPKTSKKKITELVQKTSVPAGFLLGLFVGTCSFGCTAGIYFSILGLVVTQASKGIFYLLIYNLMFIVPLIIILLLTGNKKTIKKLQELQRSETKYVTLIGGIIMVIIGLYILIPM